MSPQDIWFNDESQFPCCSLEDCLFLHLGPRNTRKKKGWDPEKKRKEAHLAVQIKGEVAVLWAVPSWWYFTLNKQAEPHRERNASIYPATIIRHPLFPKFTFWHSIGTLYIMLGDKSIYCFTPLSAEWRGTWLWSCLCLSLCKCVCAWIHSHECFVCGLLWRHHLPSALKVQGPHGGKANVTGQASDAKSRQMTSGGAHTGTARTNNPPIKSEILLSTVGSVKWWWWWP